MNHKQKQLTYYERGFLLGSSFLSGSAFVFCGHKLLSDVSPGYVYVFYVATICIFLQFILRYFIVARVFRTEKDLRAWSLSMTIALVGPITVYQSIQGPVWFLSVVLLLMLGILKTLQSKRAIHENADLTEGQKVILSRIQVGLVWYQCYVGMLMAGFWVATSTPVGDYVARKWFGVSNLALWRNGVSTLGGIVCVLAAAHLALRILVWHRDHLNFLSSTRPTLSSKAVRPSARRTETVRKGVEEKANSESKRTEEKKEVCLTKQ